MDTPYSVRTCTSPWFTDDLWLVTDLGTTEDLD
jgi:hypothetical protein